MKAVDLDQTYLAGLTVLYVEDDLALQGVTAEFLRRWVGRLVLAENGESGLAAFHAEHPQIVISDIEMPGMNGLDMVEAIKAEQAGLPIIISTAFEKPDYFLRSIALGVDRYVVKPFQSKPLKAALLHCAHQLRAEEELQRHLRGERDLLLARHHESMCILAQGMAHDYNNLLQAILASIETTLLKVQPDSPANITLGMAKRFTSLAQDLGKQLLILGEHDAGGPDRVGGLSPLVNEVLHAQLGHTEIGWANRISPDLPSVCYNHERLGMALGILVDNAREATPERGTLVVAAEVRTVLPGDESSPLGPGIYLCLSLQDSGRGIPPETLPRIFDPYFSTKDVGPRKGQGLSLALCRAILLAHGGNVTVESRVGVGSTFHVFLPVPSNQS